MNFGHWKMYIAALGLAVISVGTAAGQIYPTRPIRLVTSPPGGGGDYMSRLVAEGISGPLGQPVIVDNRQVNIIGDLVAKAPPDGYAMLLLGGVLWYPTLFQKTSYDPIKDLAPVSMLVKQPIILVVHPSVPAKSVQELVALAKAKPGTLNFGTAGLGAESYLAAELFKSRNGIDIVGVLYKDAGAAVTALLRGELQIGFISPVAANPQIKAGALRALAITGLHPSELLPGLPTLAASGLPGFKMETTQAVFVPAKTPAAIIARLNEEMVRLINKPDIKQKLLNASLEVVGSSPEELGADLTSGMATVRKLIKDEGIHTD